MRAPFLLTIYSMSDIISMINHTDGGVAMEIPNGKYAWMVKIGEKGQFVIPKEARELFDLQPGYEILVLGDAERGIAILPRKQQQEMITRMFPVDEET